MGCDDTEQLLSYLFTSNSKMLEDLEMIWKAPHAIRPHKMESLDASGIHSPWHGSATKSQHLPK